MQNGRKVQNSPTILLLSQLLYNVNLMTLAEADSFFIIVLTITEVMKERPDLPDLPVQA